MIEFGLFESIFVALIGGAAGGAFTPWFSARMEKAKKRRDLFEPIYNNISSISEDGLYRSNAKKWDTMSASNQLLVPPEIEEDLNTYSEKCSDYQTKYAQLFYSRGEFDSVLPDELYNVHGDREGPEVRVPSSESEMRVVNIRLPDLIRRLKLHTCENPDEVRKRIMQDAERRGETPYLNSIQYLNTNHPHWTSDIYEVLQSDISCEWIARRKEVREFAKNLKPKLRRYVLPRTDRLKRRFTGLW